MTNIGDEIQLIEDAEEHYEVKPGTIFTVKKVITSEKQHQLFDPDAGSPMYILKNFNWAIYDFEIQ